MWTICDVKNFGIGTSNENLKVQAIIFYLLRAQHDGKYYNTNNLISQMHYLWLNTQRPAS